MRLVQNVPSNCPRIAHAHVRLDRISRSITTRYICSRALASSLCASSARIFFYRFPSKDNSKTEEMTELPKRHVLSIQSHVVSGYVGNKSATFPLQLLGYEVDAINSVQLSNHTGYKVVKGQILNDQDLGSLVDGLAENDLDMYSHLLTGYVGSASFLKRIAQLVPVLKSKNPNLIYVCDPVMGDNGKMYVPPELAEIYRTDIVPLADILTPNQFELELLTGMKIESMTDLTSAIEKLHRMGPKTVAISSTELDNKLTAVVSSGKDTKKIKMDIPRIPAIYTGSGDLFAALFLAHSDSEASIKTVLEKTINTLHAVLLKTHETCLANKDAKAQNARKIELRLIQSKSLIENPPNKLVAVEAL